MRADLRVATRVLDRPREVDHLVAKDSADPARHRVLPSSPGVPPQTTHARATDPPRLRRGPAEAGGAPTVRRLELRRSSPSQSLVAPTAVPSYAGQLANPDARNGGHQAQPTRCSFLRDRQAGPSARTAWTGRTPTGGGALGAQGRAATIAPRQPGGEKRQAPGLPMSPESRRRRGWRRPVCMQLPPRQRPPETCRGGGEYRRRSRRMDALAAGQWGFPAGSHELTAQAVARGTSPTPAEDRERGRIG
jgi:hypothetical protein